MTSEDKIKYIANVAWISAVDGKVSPLEAKAIENIRQEIGATESDLHKSLTLIAQGSYQLAPVGRFSDKVRNLEDMVFVSMADGDFAQSEKSEVLSFAKAIKVTQDQLTEIVSAAKQRVELQTAALQCNACGQEIPSNSKFCPKCGVKL